MLVTLLPMVTLVKLSQLEKMLPGIFSTLSPKTTFIPSVAVPAFSKTLESYVRSATARAL